MSLPALPRTAVSGYRATPFGPDFQVPWPLLQYLRVLLLLFWNLRSRGGNFCGTQRFRENSSSPCLGIRPTSHGKTTVKNRGRGSLLRPRVPNLFRCYPFSAFSSTLLFSTMSKFSLLCPTSLPSSNFSPFVQLLSLFSFLLQFCSIPRSRKNL